MKGLYVRGELQTEQTATYWPQIPLSLAALLSRFAALLNRGSWGASPLWELVLTKASYFQLTKLVCGPGLYNCLTSTCFCGRHISTQFKPSTVKIIPWYIRPDAPVIYTGTFLIWQLGRGSICNIILSLSVSLSLSTAIRLYRQLLKTVFLDGIQGLHRYDARKSILVGQNTDMFMIRSSYEIVTYEYFLSLPEESSMIFSTARVVFEMRGFLFWFLCSMEYQPSWVFECQSHHCRRKAYTIYFIAGGKRGS